MNKRASRRDNMEKIIFCEECGKDKVHYLEENDFRHTEHSHWVCLHHSEEEQANQQKV